MTKALPFLCLENITVKSLNKVLFTNLNFNMNKGEHWAIVGESGSGKTAFLSTIAGILNVTKGRIYHAYFERFKQQKNIDDPFFGIHQVVSFVQQKHHFRNLSNTGEFYYQQRFNSANSEDSQRVKEYLHSIKRGPVENRVWSIGRVIEIMHLDDLLDKELIKLSNGETRRLLIGAALIKNPLLLLLDNPLTGLDTNSREEFLHIFSAIVKSGIAVVLSTSPTEIPDEISHVAVLKNGLIEKSCTRADYTAEVKEFKNTAPDTTQIQKFLKPLVTYTNIVKMTNVSVEYSGKKILNELNWQVKQGERWALSGPNGAGKSTLLSLINGDNPQAYSNDIILFDQQRGSGESIWDIKKKTGYVSPELLQYFPAGSNCMEIIESGFYDTLGLFRPASDKYRNIIENWMDLLQISQYKNSLFSAVSASIQRLCLLARALAKNPTLLILDEPCQGLDTQQQEHFKAIIDVVCMLNNSTLIYVTHYPEELPPSINKFIHLEKGIAQIIR